MRKTILPHSWLVHVFTQPGSKAKYSLEVDVFRAYRESGLKSDITPCRKVPKD